MGHSGVRSHQEFMGLSGDIETGPELGAPNGCAGDSQTRDRKARFGP